MGTKWGQRVKYICQSCGKPFERLPNYVRAIQENGYEPKYCCKKCSSKGRIGKITRRSKHYQGER